MVKKDKESKFNIREGRQMELKSHKKERVVIMLPEDLVRGVEDIITKKLQNSSGRKNIRSEVYTELIKSGFELELLKLTKNTKI